METTTNIQEKKEQLFNLLSQVTKLANEIVDFHDDEEYEIKQSIAKAINASDIKEWKALAPKLERSTRNRVKYTMVLDDINNASGRLL